MLNTLFSFLLFFNTLAMFQDQPSPVPPRFQEWFAAAGIPESLWEDFTSVAFCESHDGYYFDAAAEGDGVEAKGLMQIHWEFWTKGSEEPTWIAMRDQAGFDPNSDWADPVLNVQLANIIGNFDVSRGNDRWRQWTSKPSWDECQGWRYIENSIPEPLLGTQVLPTTITEPPSIPQILTALPPLPTIPLTPTSAQTATPTPTVTPIAPSVAEEPATATPTATPVAAPVEEIRPDEPALFGMTTAAGLMILLGLTWLVIVAVVIYLVASSWAERRKERLRIQRQAEQPPVLLDEDQTSGQAEEPPQDL